MGHQAGGPGAPSPPGPSPFGYCGASQAECSAAAGEIQRSAHQTSPRFTSGSRAPRAASPPLAPSLVQASERVGGQRRAEPVEVAPRVDVAALLPRGDELDHRLHLGLRQLVDQAFGDLASRHPQRVAPAAAGEVQAPEGRHPLSFAAIPADQAWFWTEEWQKGEREVDEDIAAGRVKRFDSVEELFEDLDAE